jgi:hypothetical protein
MKESQHLAVIRMVAPSRGAETLRPAVATTPERTAMRPAAGCLSTAPIRSINLLETVTHE